MMRGAVLLCLIGCCLARAGPSPPRSGRITGGTDAAIERFPYMVSLHLTHSTKICGAAIISSTWALTSAACAKWAEAPSNFYLRAGSTRYDEGGTEHPVVQVVTHSGYDSTSKDYNIALLRVAAPFPLGDAGVASIALPDAGETVTTGASALLAGWGGRQGTAASYTYLQQLALSISATADCEFWYPNDPITERMVCTRVTTNGQAACTNDMGGPLVVGDKVVGVLVRGMACGVAGNPEVYTRVAAFRTWITGNTGL